MKKDLKQKVSAKRGLTSFIEDDLNHNDFAEISTEDIGIPFINILQDLSPQIKKGSPDKIDGAESGDIYESVNGGIYKDGITVIPCAFQKRYIEWVPRDEGGGFVASHDNESILNDVTVNDKGRMFLENGNEILPTALHFVLVVPDKGEYYRAVISMTRTKRKKSKQWIGKMMSNKLRTSNGELYTPRMCRYSYKLTTVLETKDNNTYYNWKIGQPKLVDDIELYNEGVLFSKTFMKEKIDFSKSESHESKDEDII